MSLNPSHSVRRVAVIAVVAGLVGCAGSPDSRRYSRKKAQRALQKLEKPGVVIGEFTLAREAVVDGDQIKVDGLETSLRLLAIDTEEKFRNKGDERAALSDWNKYVRDKRAESRKPPKMASPMGEQATKYAKKFFASKRRVRLERDHPKEIRGRYNRYLAYVFVEQAGKWVNYNVECVRAGMSPYFTKYGYSRRFHDEFVAAEKQARDAKRGVWDPTKKNYGDYDARRVWWDARADFIKQFEKEAVGQDNHIMLTNWDAPGRLEEHLDKEVILLASVGEIKIGDGRRPTKVLLSRRLFNDFPLIFFDNDVFGRSGVADFKGEFIRVRGFVSKYHNKYNNRDVLQIMVKLPGQITGSPIPDFEERE